MYVGIVQKATVFHFLADIILVFLTQPVLENSEGDTFKVRQSILGGIEQFCGFVQNRRISLKRYEIGHGYCESLIESYQYRSTHATFIYFD